MNSIVRAIEVFVRGFAFTRSFTHPYVVESCGPLWVLRDAPRSGGDCRNEEWIAYGTAPEAVDRIVGKNARGRFAISVICGADESDQPLRAGFKALGYRLRTTEVLMVHDLERLPRCAAPMGITIERVTNQADADRLAKAARSRQILPEQLDDAAPIRQYVAMHGDQVVGWVRSILVEAGGTATWCSNMRVIPEFRRRGIARAMLCRMLREDRSRGADAAILLASHAGAKLYPVVGYRQIGMLMLFGRGKAFKA